MKSKEREQRKNKKEKLGETERVASRQKLISAQKVGTAKNDSRNRRMFARIGGKAASWGRYAEEKLLKVGVSKRPRNGWQGTGKGPTRTPAEEGG